MITINVREGEPGDVSMSALIVPIDSAGLWTGDPHVGVRRKTGKAPYDVVRRKTLRNGQVHFVPVENSGPIKALLFVVDDFHVPIGQLLLPALRAADERNIAHVFLLPMRTGASAGWFEGEGESTAPHALAHTVDVLRAFASEAGNVKEITIIVSDDEATLNFLRRRILHP